MSNLQHRQSIIQEKRMHTDFRDFLMEIASRYTLNLYKINTEISRYPDTTRKWNVTNSKEYLPIETNPEGSDFDSKDFIREIMNLWFTTSKPMITSFQIGNENNDYADICFWVKNCYLSFSVWWGCENVLYSLVVYANCNNVYNSCFITKNCNNISNSVNITESMNVFYSSDIVNSSNIRFSNNLVGCEECIDCENLVNQKYSIHNIQFTKESYQTEKSKLLSKCVDFTQNKWLIWWVRLSDDVENAYLVSRIIHGRNLICMEWVDCAEYMFDSMESWLNSSHFYWVLSSWTQSEHIYCSLLIACSSFVFYSFSLENCSFCVGCIGLKNKSYCILNKQYTKEERYIEVDKIFWQMNEDGVLGDFFPATMNPFYFNDTAAYLIDPSFTKEEVIAKWYLRRDEPIKVDIPAGVQTVSVKDLDKYEWRTVGTHGNASEKIRTIDDEILKKVIIDEQGNAYRIIPMELEFLRKYELPLPRKHWLDRMKENFRIN